MLFWANIQSVKLQRRKERGKLFFVKWIILVFLGGFLGGILYMLQLLENQMQPDQIV